MQTTHPIGEVEVDSGRVPWIDLRGTDVRDSLEERIRHCLRDLSDGGLGPPQLRLIVLAAPQLSDALALVLARQGIHLLVGPLETPAVELLDRLQEDLRWLAATSNTAASGDPFVPDDLRRHDAQSEHIFRQRSPWFDQHAFDERMRILQQPWQDEDRSKLEY